MIENIQLRRVLPDVFKGMENDMPMNPSDIWLRDVDIHRPDSCLIVADSGTGKSSLCSFIYGCRGDYSGTISFDGTDISTFSTAQWCRLRTHALAYLPQELNLFPELTVMENIEIKNRLTDCKSTAWIKSTLQRLDIDAKADVPVRFLSVGQQQRVAIVRALCQPFDFLLIDEPVSHLDQRNNSIVASLIKEEAETNGASIIATSVGNKIDINFHSTLRL